MKPDHTPTRHTLTKDKIILQTATRDIKFGVPLQPVSTPKNSDKGLESPQKTHKHDTSKTLLRSLRGQAVGAISVYHVQNQQPPTYA